MAFGEDGGSPKKGAGHIVIYPVEGHAFTCTKESIGYLGLCPMNPQRTPRDKEAVSYTCSGQKKVTAD